MTQTTRSALLSGLLACGVLSSAVYVASDMVGALSYPGYDYAAQAISEMSAIGAPTVALLAPFYRAFSIVFLAFAAGVWLVGARDHRLRWSAGFMIGVAIVGLGLSHFPMNMRGAGRTLSDTMHLVFSGATILLLTGAILSGASAFRRPFRLYSGATVLVMLVFFMLTMLDVPNVAANRPTPYMGLNERVSMAAWLLWVALLSVKLCAAELGGSALRKQDCAPDRHCAAASNRSTLCSRSCLFAPRPSHWIVRSRCSPCVGQRPCLEFIRTRSAIRSGAEFFQEPRSGAAGASSRPTLLHGFARDILRTHGCS